MPPTPRSTTNPTSIPTTTAAPWALRHRVRRPQARIRRSLRLAYNTTSNQSDQKLVQSDGRVRAPVFLGVPGFTRSGSLRRSGPQTSDRDASSEPPLMNLDIIRNEFAPAL